MDQRGRAASATYGRHKLTVAVACIIGGLVVGALWWNPAAAQANRPPPDQACKLCHGDSEEQYVFPSGETVPVGVDLEMLSQSVHGIHAPADLYCTDCHVGDRRYRYPHQPNPAQNHDEFVAEISQNCEQCHTPATEHNPGHLQLEDQTNVPVCADCHGGHDVAPAQVMAADPVAACQSCHQSYDDPHVQEVHAEVVANFGPDQDCQTCHSDTPQPADAKCQSCHSLLTSELTLGPDETISLHVDPEDVMTSVHGEGVVDGVAHDALLCTDCHQDQARYGFPHAPLTEITRRELTVDMEKVCLGCHEDIAALHEDSVHEKANAEGNLNAATCADCHSNHAIHDPNEPRSRVSDTCGKCHSTIYDQYAHSVHGAALLGEENPDVAVCTDCHRGHEIPDPTTAAFRLSSPEMCGKCHADKEKMAKYGISTDVFDTYVADFHGTTVELFEKHSPAEQTNKAVCYDCHGVHNILPVTDENSQVIKENLLTTCRQCHPDATANFPDAWTSHFKPSLQNNTLVYLVDLFYLILIPATLGIFAIFIGSDVFRRASDHRRGRKGPSA